MSTARKPLTPAEIIERTFRGRGVAVPSSKFLRGRLTGLADAIAIIEAGSEGDGDVEQLLEDLLGRMRAISGGYLFEAHGVDRPDYAGGHQPGEETDLCPKCRGLPGQVISLMAQDMTFHPPEGESWIDVVCPCGRGGGAQGTPDQLARAAKSMSISCLHCGARFSWVDGQALFVPVPASKA